MFDVLGFEPDNQGLCERCNEEIGAPNIEAFEITGLLLCEDCAEWAFQQEDA